jgi:hypothetical protein
MLNRLGLNVCATSVAIVAEAIPLNFYNDIVWGLALGECSGKFENYRIRINLPGGGTTSILFNISGFRDDMLVIHSLWQTVSIDEGNSHLCEGSILTEVRIHDVVQTRVTLLTDRRVRNPLLIPIKIYRKFTYVLRVRAQSSSFIAYPLILATPLFLGSIST